MTVEEPKLKHEIKRIAGDIASLQEQVHDMSRASQAAFRSVEDGSMYVYDADGNLRVVFGQQVDGTFTIRDLNGGAPDVPSDPIVEAHPGLLQITWDGYGLSDNEWLLDWSHVEVHVSTTSGFTPDSTTMVASITSRQGGTVAIALDGGITYYVVFVAVSTSGDESTPSAEIAGTPTLLSDLGGINTYEATTPPIGLTTEDAGDLWVDTDGGNALYRWDGTQWVQIPWGLDSLEPSVGTRINTAITTYYQTTAPATANTGDFWLDTDDGNKLYRWDGAAWVNVQDAAIQQALTDAADAQSTADGKIVTFAQATQPTATAVGDLWLDTDDDNKLYRWSGSAWVALQMGYNALATAIATRINTSITTYYQTTPPATANTGDMWLDTDDGNRLYRWNGSAWVDVQDSDIQAALTAAGDAQATADGKIVTFAQATAPVATAVGDLWMDTDDLNKLYRWDGAAWVNVRDGGVTQAQADAANALQTASDAQATADGKVVTFVQTTQPTATAVGDLWFDSDDGYKAYRWDGATWVNIQDLDISQALSDASNAQATADGKIVTFYQTAAPAATAVGDLWVDTDDGNKLYRWSGSAWVAVTWDLSALATAVANRINTSITTYVQTTAPATANSGDFWLDSDDGYKLYRWNGASWQNVQDAGIQQALTDAADAQATADGKIVTFAQTTAPTATSVGDLWIDTDDDNKVYRWNGTSWVAYQTGLNALATPVQTRINSAITTYVQTSAPTTHNTGDFWLDSDDGYKLYRWDGATWQNVQDQAIQTAITNAAAASDLADSKMSIYYQATAPTVDGLGNALGADDAGDIWIETDNGNKLYRWDGTQWVNFQIGMETLAIVAPSTSPNPTVTGSVGTLHVQWDPVSGSVSPFSVEVHISTTSGFTATKGNTATLAGTSVNGTGLTIRTMPDGSQLEYEYMDVNGDTQTRVYYVKTIAFNDAGTASPSAEASGSLIKVTTNDIAVNQAWVGTMDVDNLTGGTLDAEIIIGEGVIRAEGANGAKVEMDGMGFRVVDSGGDILVNFPTDDSGQNVFVTAIDATNITVDSLYVEQGSLQGTFQLNNGVQDPVSAPSVYSTYAVQNTDLALPTAPSNNDWKYRTPGGCWSDGTYLYWIARTNSGDLYYWLLKAPLDGSSTGVARAQLSSVGGSSDRPDYWIHGVCGIAGTLYVCARRSSDDALVFMRYSVSDLSSLGNVLASSFTFGTTCPGVQENGWPMAITTDGSYLYVAYTDKSTHTLRVRQYSTTGNLVQTLTSSRVIDMGDGLYCLSLLVGTFDFGATRYILNSGWMVHSFTASAGVLTEQTNESWDLPYVANVYQNSYYDNTYGVSGIWWDGTRFNSLGSGNSIHTHLVTRRYSTIKWTTEYPKWWFQYAWWDPVNGYESKPSNMTNFWMLKRGWWVFTAPQAPSTVANKGIRIYAGRGSTAPANTAMWLQTGLNGLTSVTSEIGLFSGTNPRTTSSFLSVTPAVIQSEALNAIDGGPSIYLGGDGTALFEKVTLRSTTDVNQNSGNQPPLRIGNVSGQHLRIDGNEIQSMSSDTAVGQIGLNGKFFTKFGYGSDSVNTNASGEATIGHNLGVIPDTVVVTSRNNGTTTICTVTNKTSTNFTVRFDNVNGNPRASINGIGTCWWAIG